MERESLRIRAAAGFESLWCDGGPELRPDLAHPGPGAFERARADSNASVRADPSLEPMLDRLTVPAPTVTKTRDGRFTMNHRSRLRPARKALLLASATVALTAA